MALVLLIGAGLLIRTIGELRAVDPGFDAANKLALDVWLPWKKYREGPKQVALFQEAERRLNNLPGVVSAGVFRRQGNRRSEFRPGDLRPGEMQCGRYREGSCRSQGRG